MLIITIITNLFHSFLATLKTNAMLTSAYASYFPKGYTDLFKAVFHFLVYCLPCLLAPVLHCQQ